MSEDLVLLDLDGVVWKMDEPIPGSPEAIARLRAAGWRVAFFTNNSFPPHAELVARLERIGVACAPEELLSSPQAAAMLCEPGERALVVGGAGILEALSERGVEVVAARPGTDSEGFDVVVVGIDPAFDYATIDRASAALRAGARLVATNDDATFPLPDRLVPGAGAVLAAVATASGARPEIAGKPHAASARLVAKVLGEVSLVVGDRDSTDGALARAVGAPFALVYSGVTARGARSDVAPDREADDLAALVDELLRNGEVTATE